MHTFFLHLTSVDHKEEKKGHYFNNVYHGTPIDFFSIRVVPMGFFSNAGDLMNIRYIFTFYDTTVSFEMLIPSDTRRVLPIEMK